MSDISDTQNQSSTNGNEDTTNSTKVMESSDPKDQELAASSAHDKTQSSHSTGVADKGNWSTQRIAIYALFVALAMAASFIEFPIMPGVPWLKYDLSGIICLVAGFAFGPMAAFIVSVLSWIPHLFMNPWGAIMSIAVSVFLSVPAAMVYKRMRTRVGALVGILVGVVFGLIAAIGGNLLITPIYAHMTTAQVLKMVIPVLLPFNLIKFAIHGVVTFVIYKPISNLLNR
ncbi:ECF transporter S component [Bifidobacterium sp. ESL0690]|uniref:ECF transporter S component n=1 Tax=Bifidobacterium sp. ESL0690 TaxID=2983214 RepID=UPI0023F76448|nr:ECF transporter S component [Bifidobacterium sp. ESL0690]WEV45988.1 ECF transporter S component [Bifidobacterium sp. ESL0690]